MHSDHITALRDEAQSVRSTALISRVLFDLASWRNRLHADIDEILDLNEDDEGYCPTSRTEWVADGCRLDYCERYYTRDESLSTILDATNVIYKSIANVANMAGVDLRGCVDRCNETLEAFFTAWNLGMIEHEDIFPEDAP